MTLMQILKEQTAAAHFRVETEFRLPERLASRSRYLDLLQRLQAFHEAWERTADRWIDPALLAPRRKAYLLGDDIAALSGGSDALAAPEFFFVRCTASALGAMYVVEGSMLGGAIIAKEVERRLGLSGASGCAFFRAYGSELASRWRAFGAHVDAQQTGAPEMAATVVAGANAMFATMGDSLRGDFPARSSVAA
jgi:heme oxygenase